GQEQQADVGRRGHPESGRGGRWERLMPATAAGRSGQIERVHRLLGDLLARDAWSRERLLSYQRARLRGLLEHAVTSAPYYRRALGPDAADAPLAELPTLSKATL